MLIVAILPSSIAPQMLMPPASAASAPSDSLLLDYLFSGYDKRIRPFADSPVPVFIELTIVLAILTELRENQQVASYVISHIQKWRDPRLSWDPAMFNGLRQIVVPRADVWLPKLFIYNSMDTKEMLSDNYFDVRLTHQGKLKINMPQYVTCICRLDIALFPFDTQFCAIAQASPLLGVEEMDVNVTEPPKDSYFSGNAEWELFNVSVRDTKFWEDGEQRVEVHYVMHMRRRPVYYLTVIVAPTFLISFLSILGIFAPGTNEGPRSEKSNEIPLLGFYIISTILLCAFAVAVNMALLTVSRRFVKMGQIPSKNVYSSLLLDPSTSPRQDKYWEERYEQYLSTSEAADEESKGHQQQQQQQQQTNGGAARRASAFCPSMGPFVDARVLLAFNCQLKEIVAAQRVFRKKVEKRKRHLTFEPRSSACGVMSKLGQFGAYHNDL
uniref:Neur_chan_LBD domain-containing protein n=1 Tax=Globodera pallida TaxID=36090 RepID=A0A183BZH7_GLOPA